MNKYNFTTTHTELVAVKIPLFYTSLNDGVFSVQCFYIPFDIYNDIKKKCKKFYHGAPLISLSHYLYLLRFRRDFFRYLDVNRDNFYN